MVGQSGLGFSLIFRFPWPIALTARYQWDSSRYLPLLLASSSIGLLASNPLARLCVQPILD
jgi:hypothetical protein